MPFRDIVGHHRLVGLLARSINRATLPQSLILAGPSGVGKRLVAVATAQAINCTERVERRPSGDGRAFDVDSCGVCSTCARIARGLHPDVLVVQPGDSGSIKVDQAREIVDRAAYRPFEGRRRVVIVDDAEALVTAAQNALLKTLEEPPSSSVFLLVTSRPDMLLPTVRSRCPQLRFRPLGAAEVAAVLLKQGRSEAEARAVAAVADGSIGRALEVSGDAFVEARDLAMRVLEQAAGGFDPRRRLEGAKELLSGTGRHEREQLAVGLRAMAAIVRDVELVAAGADRRALANPDVAPAIDRLTAFRGERGTRAFQAIDGALAALDRNASAKIVADWLVLQL
jgi:DNA polymerase-3 subunit delta'